MKFAVTGSSGFVGSNVARLLRSEGHEVVPVSRRDGVDIQSEAELENAFSGCDGVAHCAGINREIGSQSYDNIHVEGTRKVINAAKICGVKKVTLMSFLKARPNCSSGYHESKFAAEEIVAQSGMDYTVIKAGVIYGRGDHMLNHLSHAFYTFPVFGLVGFKDQKIRPTAVDDVARIIIASFFDPRLSDKRVPVTGPEELTLTQAVKRVAQVVGRAPLFFPMPVWMHVVFAWGLELLMKVPLISTAQVRILAEGLVEPAGVWDPLPEDLAPKTSFSEDSIRRGLPSPGPFTLKDLRLPV